MRRKGPWLSLPILLISTSLAFASPLNGSKEARQVVEIKENISNLNTTISRLNKDIENLKQQQRNLESKIKTENTLFKNNLEMQNNRISDIGLATSQQANYVSFTSNLTTFVGLGVTLIFSLIAILTGFAVYRNAKTDAQAAAQQWLDDNSNNLTNEIQEIHQEIQDFKMAALAAKQEMDDLRDGVSAHATQVHEHFELEVRKALSAETIKTDPSAPPPRVKKINAFEKASEALKSKPENQFNSDDYFARGLQQYTNQHLESALLSFREAIRLARPSNENPERLAQKIFALALTYGQLGIRSKELIWYNKLYSEFKNAGNMAIQSQLATALTNKAIRLAQLNRLPESLETYKEIKSRYEGIKHPEIQKKLLIASSSRAAVLSNAGHLDEALLACDEIINQYSEKEHPEYIDQIFKTKNTRAFTRILKAKINWDEKDSRTFNLKLALEELREIAQSKRYIILGNLGYALYLLDDADSAVAPTRECLEIGGKTAFDLQMQDTKINPVPKDAGYKMLLTGLWESVNSTAS